MAVFMPIMFRQMQQLQNQPDMAQPARNLDPASGVRRHRGGRAGLRRTAPGGWSAQLPFPGKDLGDRGVSVRHADVLTCYCLPTAVALAVYGLIVYLNPEVSEAFRMGEAGSEPAEIVAAFPG